MSTIGVVADTHDEVVPWGPVRERLGAAFAGVSLVVHCGDATSAAVLDGLADIAPVVAVRTAADPPPDPPRLVDGPRVVEHDGIAVGIVATLPADADVVALFGRPVRLVLHGGTHAPAIEDRGDTLLVNPGSPTLAARPTAALVTITAPDLTATIVEV